MRVKLFLAIMLVISCVYATTPPWNDKGTFRSILAIQGGYTLNPFDPWVVVDSYNQEYGLIPDIILFDDIQDTSSIISIFSFVYNPYYMYAATSEDTVWWMDVITWGDLRPHLKAYLKNTVTDCVEVFQLPNYDLNRNIAHFDTGSYSVNFQTPISLLDITSSDTLYNLWVEPATSPKPQYIEVDTLSIVKTNRNSCVDTLYWMYRNWDDAIESDVDLPTRMLVHYPNDTRLLRTQFWRYYDAVNCDSVGHYGQRLVQVWQSDSSMYMMDHLSNFDMHQAIQDVEERIKHICVDGQPQPKTALGWSEI